MLLYQCMGRADRRVWRRQGGSEMFELPRVVRALRQIVGRKRELGGGHGIHGHAARACAPLGRGHRMAASLPC